MSLFNNDSNMAGIYRGKITKPDNKNNKKRLYIPSIHTINPYEYDGDKFEEALQLLPEARFDTPEPPQDNMSCYIVFEGGNIKYPVVVGFLGDEIQKTVYINSGSSENNIGNDNINQDGEDSGTNSPNDSNWLWPCNSKTITSNYGNRIHPVTKQKSFHNGIDIGEPLGGSIFAIRDGVIKSKTTDGSNGNRVIIDHGDGFKSIYCHLNSFSNISGNVKQGDCIGYCGSTGRSTGPHLHISIKYNDEYVNPCDYIS